MSVCSLGEWSIPAGQWQSPGWFSGTAAGRGCPLWAQAGQRGGGVLGSFPGMFSLYTNLSLDLCLECYPIWGAPFLLPAWEY